VTIFKYQCPKQGFVVVVRHFHVSRGVSIPKKNSLGEPDDLKREKKLSGAEGPIFFDGLVVRTSPSRAEKCLLIA